MKEVLLPIEGRLFDSKSNYDTAKEKYEAMGIEILGEKDNTTFFVKLPDGWTIVPDGLPPILYRNRNINWDYILDESGKRRARFKFDGDEVWTVFNTRYDIWFRENVVVVTDGYKNDVIQFEYNDDTSKGIAFHKAYDFLDSNYPEWKNVDTYWD